MHGQGSGLPTKLMPGVAGAFSGLPTGALGGAFVLLWLRNALSSPPARALDGLRCRAGQGH